MKLQLCATLIAMAMMAPSVSTADNHKAEDKAESGQTLGEKAKDTARDTKRATKKGYHRVKEAVCMKGDVECAAEKAKHRVEEATDATVDKAKEIKDKVD